LPEKLEKKDWRIRRRMSELLGGCFLLHKYLIKITLNLGKISANKKNINDLLNAWLFLKKITLEN